tara:strand:+ start:1194 stop:1361 length:168 start_codon:yes stop_codon:yes gene_type:complete
MPSNYEAMIWEIQTGCAGSVPSTETERLEKLEKEDRNIDQLIEAFQAGLLPRENS